MYVPDSVILEPTFKDDLVIWHHIRYHITSWAPWVLAWNRTQANFADGYSHNAST